MQGAKIVGNACWLQDKVWLRTHLAGGQHRHWTGTGSAPGERLNDLVPGSHSHVAP